MPLTAALFDFDGILLDTESTVLQSWLEEYEHHGLVLDDHSWQATVGCDSDRYAALAAAVHADADLEAGLRR
jgi:beta-phosphoglucomutase-like phosphatase (HAD superfamily)